MESAKSSRTNQSPINSLSVDKLRTKAVEQEKAGKLEEAVAFYLKAISLESQQPSWVYCHTIDLLIELKRLAAGLSIAERAIVVHGKSSKIYRALERLYSQAIDTANHLNHYQQLLTFEPKQPDWLYYNLTRQLWHSDRASEAIKVASKGIKLYQDFHPLQYLLGNILEELGQKDKATALYQRVKQLNPNWLDVKQKLDQAVSQQVQTRTSNPSQPELDQSIVQRDSNIDSRKHQDFQDLDIDHLFAQLKARQLTLSESNRLWQNSGDKLDLDYGCWLSPSVLYLEVKVNNPVVLGQFEILASSSDRYAVGKANFRRISPQIILGIACFRDNLYLDNQSYRFCLNYQNTPVFISRRVEQEAFGLKLIDYLKTKSDFLKQHLRESISSSIISLISQERKPEAGKILQTLQYFLDIPKKDYVDPNLPFKIFIDYLIPLKSDGLFISGWLQDAYEMLEKITIVSALGFSLELPKEDIYRIERNDVDRFLQNTPYSNFEEDFGFCAYVSLPGAIRDSIAGFAELHSFRFLVELRGEIEIEIVPDAKYGDFYSSRQKVMQIVSPDKITPAMLNKCIAPVAFKLQQFCMEQVRIKSVTQIGEPVTNPLVSLIIPLYRRLDFMKIQLATMANDPAIAQCEIIYVLDSPEQEEELRTFLDNHSTLYQLSVKLVIMQRNSGYAAANNAGASQAKGEYLILLNSDVFAKTKGWMTQMADFYASSPKIGALGAKLLYEDNSLQHAGMFFVKTTYPFWLTLHYYKGLPEKYPPAQTTKAVPAVTGACLMISKKLYEEVGGLTTDYVIGDFEDSDLCFKCSQLGYENWYYADVSLYHLERQSVPLNSSYSGSLAWLLNGHLHQKRWGKEIEEISNKFGK